jgi:hypothetical protein
MQKPTPNWLALPPSLRTDPSVTAMRLDHLEARQDHLEARQEAQEEAGPATIETPVGKLPWPVVVALLALLLIFRPDLLHLVIPAK